MSFQSTVERVRALCGTDVVATLYGADGSVLAHWEGELEEEELDAEAVADRLAPQVTGDAGAEERVRALRDGEVALFQVGRHPFVIDRIDTTAAEPLAPAGVRVRNDDGTVVELTPA